ncbi:MAG: ABC transporter ATP-binding protein [Bryobacteraceae bacterium]
MSCIDLSGVSRRFGNRIALRPISITIEGASRVVLFGPSGCGKTTVLRLIAGLLTPDTGVVSINGQIVARDGANIIEPEQRHIGMVFQDLALWPHMTVKGNLDFGLRSRKVPAPERARRIEETLRLVGLTERMDARPHQLSGGEQQRIALARALVLQPKILLMDEPLSSLDEVRRNELCSELVNLQQQLSWTLVYVTHDRLEAERVGQRILRMRDGERVTG